MSIEQTSVVDFVSINKEGEVMLTISDHLEWDDRNQHLKQLQEKINAYLRFIESGEIYETYPNAKDKKIIISIHAMHQPNSEARKFITKITEELHKAGYVCRFEEGIRGRRCGSNE